jgi:hypothetical protein
LNELIKIFLIKDFGSIKYEIMEKQKKQIADIVNKLKRTDLQKFDEKKFSKISSKDIELDNKKYVPVSNDLNDDNSLYSAISILLFGNDSNYRHIRLSIVYFLLTNANEYEKKFKDKKKFKSLVEQIVKTGFHSELPFSVVANLLGRTLKVYKWENFTEPQNIYQPDLQEKEKKISKKEAENVNNKDPLIIVKKNNHFIPLLKEK